MDIEVLGGEDTQLREAQGRESEQPLLQTAPKPPKTKTQKAIRKTFKGTANLVKLLPTGSVVTYQILCPVLTHQGRCPTVTSVYFSIGLLIFCTVSTFVLCFTDSFRDERGKVRYGLATRRGLWVIDGSVTLPAEEAQKYRLRFIDFLHATMSVLVFVGMALLDRNVVKCLFPKPSVEAKELLVTLPVVLEVLCGMVFLAFPTRRHGIGAPLSKE